MKNSDWNILQNLRSHFLDNSDQARRRDYWDKTKLELYDQSFAQRIAWKWDAVCEEVQQKWQAPNFESILDWGCGTGIASRTFLKHFSQSTSEILLHDRSAESLNFASQKIKSEFSKHSVKKWDHKTVPDVLLLSHVLNELDAKTLENLKDLISKCKYTFWVEAGTHEISRKLISVRESFLDTKTLLAPCPHQKACPMLQEARTKDWCHNFAKTPSEVFQSAFWSEFSKRLKIDLRSLPASFLILGDEEFLRDSKERILGRPKKLKSHLEFQTCTPEGTLEDRKILKRSDAKAYKNLSEIDFFTEI